MSSIDQCYRKNPGKVTVDSPQYSHIVRKFKTDFSTNRNLEQLLPEKNVLQVVFSGHYDLFLPASLLEGSASLRMASAGKLADRI